MSFTAGYPGECVECEGRIEIGHRIQSVSGDYPDEHLGYRHTNCPDEPNLTAERACHGCHLIHAPAQKECY